MVVVEIEVVVELEGGRESYWKLEMIDDVRTWSAGSTGST